MLELENVAVAYPGGLPVVQEVSFSLKKGEIACLLGPSGCGKTTVLRAIAGFERLAAGQLRIADKTVASQAVHSPPQQRGIGMVFQDHALFPHLNTANNIGFALSAMPARARQARVDELLDLVGLVGHGQRWPHELSGGQQQRVALARALAPQPALLLLDEPFSNLDSRLRETIAREVRSILRHAGATALMVTHDQTEAFALADHIGVMAGGRLQHWDSPAAIYARPATAAVARFVGEGMLLPAQRMASGDWQTAIGVAPAHAPHFLEPEGVRVLLRPEWVQLNTHPSQPARIKDRVYRGRDFLYTLEVQGAAPVLAYGALENAYELNEEVSFSLRWPALKSASPDRPPPAAGQS